MSNKPKPKKSFDGINVDPIRFDEPPMHDDSPRKPFDPEKLKYLLTDEAGMHPEIDLEAEWESLVRTCNTKQAEIGTGVNGLQALRSAINDHFDGTRISPFWRDEAGMMPSTDPPLTKEEIERIGKTNWIKSAAVPKRKKP